MAPNESEKHGLGNNIINGSPAPNLDLKLLLIGCYEMMPVMFGLLLAENVKPILFHFDYAVLGIIVAIRVAYSFKDDVPDQPISNSNCKKCISI